MSRTAATALLTLAILAALAGCATPDAPDRTGTTPATDTGPQTAHIAVRFGPWEDATHPPSDADLPVGERAAESFYGAAAHPPFYSAFDQLVQWASTLRHDLKVGPPTSFGFCLDRIDGVPAPGGCEQGAVGYWNLKVNGVDSMVGMDQVEVKPGDTVTWTAVALAPPPSASGTTASRPTEAGPLAIALAAPEPTRNATLVVGGTVTGPARVSLRLVHNGTTTDLPPIEAAGQWGATVEVPFGRSVLRAAADDGRTTATAETEIVRLSKGTMQVAFRGMPGHADRNDEVWFDPDSFPSLAHYEGQPVPHPGHANVHDLMVAWTAQTGVPVVYKPHASFGSQVMAIDGVGDATSTTSAFWCYEVDGASATMGITPQPFHDGIVVRWALGTCA